MRALVAAILFGLPCLALASKNPRSFDNISCAGTRIGPDGEPTGQSTLDLDWKSLSNDEYHVSAIDAEWGFKVRRFVFEENIDDLQITIEENASGRGAFSMNPFDYSGRWGLRSAFGKRATMLSASTLTGAEGQASISVVCVAYDGQENPLRELGRLN